MNGIMRMVFGEIILFNIGFMAFPSSVVTFVFASGESRVTTVYFNTLEDMDALIESVKNKGIEVVNAHE